MMAMRAVIVGTVLTASSVAFAEEFQIPPEVTPAMRAACETDVRRLCVGQSPTVAKVKACVYAKFFRLGRKCQVELASAGFSR